LNEKVAIFWGKASGNRQYVINSLFSVYYTAMKYPSSRAVDVRVKEVFSSKDGTYHRVELLHWFSHQNQFEKVQKHDDKLLQTEEAIKDLVEHIENKDELILERIEWKIANAERKIGFKYFLRTLLLIIIFFTTFI